ncbi:MAG: hypothetical protein IMY88_00895 [Chloroflexi bacterium]|nr:hypothetical protein [Chloroflexota bacterium]
MRIHMGMDWNCSFLRRCNYRASVTRHYGIITYNKVAATGFEPVTKGL